MSNNDFQWKPVNESISFAVNRSLSYWMGTPYLEGSKNAKLGCDCINGMIGIIEELENRAIGVCPTKVTALSSFHDTKAGAVVTRWMRTVIPNKRITDNSIEPGDLLISRSSKDNSGPVRAGHIMMACVDPFMIAHCQTNSKFKVSSILNVGEIIRVYRPLGKASWA